MLISFSAYGSNHTCTGDAQLGGWVCRAPSLCVRCPWLRVVINTLCASDTHDSVSWFSSKYGITIWHGWSRGSCGIVFLSEMECTQCLMELGVLSSGSVSEGFRSQTSVGWWDNHALPCRTSWWENETQFRQILVKIHYLIFQLHVAFSLITFHQIKRLVGLLFIK